MRFVLVCMLASLGGCERPYLTWTQREPLSARRGHVAVQVEDRRVGDQRHLGRAFGWGGAGRDIIVDADHVRARIERLGKEATVTAGLGLWTPSETPTARLHLDVDELACDGMRRHAHAQLSLRYSMLGADGTERIAPQNIVTQGDGSGCETALSHALDELLDELAARLVEGPAHDAAL